MTKTYLPGANRLLPIVLAATLLQTQLAAASGCDVPMFAGARLFATSPLGATMMATGDFNRDGFIDLAVINNPGSNGSSAGLSILLGNGDGTFQPAVNYAVGRPGAIAAADFNGDGKLDLAISDGVNFRIVVMPGNGDGTFGAPIPASNQSTGAMAVGDFNGDGKPDLAIGGVPAYILLGKGDGTFQALIAPAGGLLQAGFGVTAGDFNGDGKLDVVAGSQDGIFLMLGDGKGNLAAPVDFSTGATPSQVAAADINGDRKLDVVAVSGTGNNVSVLLGNGNGTFQAATTYTAGALPTSVVIADFNGDGKPDLAVANHASLFMPVIPGTISIYPGNGDGTFQPPVQYNPTAQSNSWLVAADFNGDGKPDLAFTSFMAAAPTQVGVMLANADGSFQAPNSYPTPPIPRSPVLADLNGDGIADLVVADAGFTSVISVMLGNGDGSFQPAVNYPTSFGAKSVAAGDVNGDGKPDLVVGNLTGGNLLVFLGNGDGTFQSPLSTRLSIGSGNYVALADFNNDGKLDVAVQGFGVSILLGNGDGTFRAGGTYGPSSLNADMGPIAVADLNGDGSLDLVLAASNNDGMGPFLSPGVVSVLLGNGDGTFRANVDYTIGARATSVAIGDLNGDGKPDMVVSDFAGTGVNASKIGIVAVLLGNGDGTFQTAVKYAVSATGAVAVAMSDFNGDGKMDVASLSPGDQTVTVLFGNGDGTFRDPLVYGAGLNPLAMTVGDLNGDGAPDMVFVDDVSNSVLTLLNNYVPGGAGSACSAVPALGN